MAENGVWLDKQETMQLLREARRQGALESGDLIRIKFKKKGFPGVVALNALVASGHIKMDDRDLAALKKVMGSKKWRGTQDRTFIITAGSTFRKQMFDATIRTYLESWRRIT